MNSVEKIDKLASIVYGNEEVLIKVKVKENGHTITSFARQIPYHCTNIYEIYKNMKKIVFVFAAIFCIHSQIFAQDTTKAKWVPCALKNAFGLDLGAGAINRDVVNTAVMPTLEIGMRYSHHFTPYIGIDFIKFNSKFSFEKEIDNIGFSESAINNYFSANTQWMLGARGNTPSFYKCMSGYWAVRIGFGIIYESFDYKDAAINVNNALRVGFGLCMEYEMGFNITRELFIGYACNLQINNYGVLLYSSGLSHAFRIWVNIK